MGRIIDQGGGFRPQDEEVSKLGKFFEVCFICRFARIMEDRSTTTLCRLQSQFGSSADPGIGNSQFPPTVLSESQGGKIFDKMSPTTTTTIARLDCISVSRDCIISISGQNYTARVLDIISYYITNKTHRQSNCFMNCDHDGATW